MIVIIKPSPKASAASLSFLLSIAMPSAYLVAGDKSSDVINRIMVITASHKLISDIESGGLNLIPYKSIPYFD